MNAGAPLSSRGGSHIRRRQAVDLRQKRFFNHRRNRCLGCIWWSRAPCRGVRARRSSRWGEGSRRCRPLCLFISSQRRLGVFGVGWSRACCPGTRSPARAGVMTGVVVALGVLVVAPLFERSFAMFPSIVGTWLPISAIFLANWAAWSHERRRRRSCRATCVVLNSASPSISPFDMMSQSRNILDRKQKPGFYRCRSSADVPIKAKC
jgi:hypothetical protein